MEHSMKLNAQPFEAIRNGTKSIELRLNDEKRQLLQVGDRITFRLCDSEERLSATVAALHHADSFAELFRRISPKDCGFTDDLTAKAAAEEMRAYYSEEQEQRCGVLGIGLAEVCCEG